MFENLKEILREKDATIVFTEGTDYRIQSASARLTREGLLKVILIGNVEEVEAAARKNEFDISKCQIIDPENYEDMEAMVETMVALRKGKMTEDQVRSLLKQANYFGTMLVQMGKADCLLGGANYSTADTVRPALQLIKTKPQNRIVSSVFIMIKGDEVLGFADCSVNIKPSEDDLAEIAVESARTARIFGVEPRVAMLSYSTHGSGKGETVDMMKNATAKAKEMDPSLVIDGEIQFDASLSNEVAQIKCPDSPVGGKANVFVFPDINAGNIGYKIAARLGGYEAVGPILQGLKAPINDLSRGCNAEEVYKMAIVTGAIS